MAAPTLLTTRRHHRRHPPPPPPPPQEHHAFRYRKRSRTVADTAEEAYLRVDIPCGCGAACAACPPTLPALALPGGGGGGGEGSPRQAHLLLPDAAALLECLEVRPDTFCVAWLRCMCLWAAELAAAAGSLTASRRGCQVLVCLPAPGPRQSLLACDPETLLFSPIIRPGAGAARGAKRGAAD